MRTLLLSIAAGTTLLASAQTYYVPTGSVAPDFNLMGLDGQMYHLYELTAQGRYVMLDFMQATCPPCTATAAHFAELYQTYGCNNHDLVCISVDALAEDSPGDLMIYHAAYGGGWARPPVILESAGANDLFTAYGVGSVPTFCLIGPDNVMVNDGIYGVTGIETFISAFPPGDTLEQHPCVAEVGMQEEPSTGSGGQFNINPNPAHAQLSITGSTARSYRILTTQGQLVATGRIAGNTIATDALVPGLYVLELDGVQRTRFVKE